LGRYAGAVLPMARSVSFSYPGDCGGNVSFSGVHNNGDTGGSLNLNNFCMRDAATGASNVLNGRMSLNADGTPGQTGPITSAVSAESLGVVTLVRSTGESFSMELTGLNYRYGRPGQVPTLAQQDKLTVEEFVIRNNTTGQTTKIDVVEADIGYRSPVPTTSTRGSGTVEVTGSMDVFFPNAGKVSVETLPGQPLVIDRSRSEIKSVGLEVVGAGGKSATFTVSESNPGVFVVSMSDPAFAGASVDCSELRLENQFQIIEQLADRVGSGF